MRLIWGQGHVLKQEKVHTVISELLQQRLTGLQYDPVKSAQVRSLSIELFVEPLHGSK